MTIVDNRRNWTFGILLFTVLGILLRLTGLSYEAVDYLECVVPWFEDIKAIGNITALAEYEGSYNIFYITIIYFLTLLPLPAIVSVKLVSVLFDYLAVAVLTAFVYDAAPPERRYRYSLVAYAVLICCPTAVINSGYMAQCESIWAGLGLLSFYLIRKGHPVWGMLSFGCALAMKPQGVFILPILLIDWFYSRRYSIFHLLWIPVAIQLISIPAMIGGSEWYVFYRFFRQMAGQYPYVYYYYPNFWTYLQDAPYYVFGKVAIFSAMIALLLFAVLFVRAKSHDSRDYLEAISYTSMTCAMILPCMHERYNFMGELALVACSVITPRYRVPALLLILASTQCYGQAYLGWFWVPHELLAAVNIAVYLYVAYRSMSVLWRTSGEKEVCV